MPSKVYSIKQKEEIKEKLLETGLQMYSKYGIKEVKMMDILKIVGISKPFFYTYFDSVQTFVVEVLEYQWCKFPSLLETIKQEHSHWEDQLYAFFHKMVHYREYGFLILTQEEEVWVRNRINEKQYHDFMNHQYTFFENLLLSIGLKKGACNPKVISNMAVTMIVLHSSAKRSLPFFYLDDLEETATAHAESIVAYIKKYR